MRVWLWHTSEEAEVLPGARGFGWFFRYLTFFGFTLQTLQLNTVVAAWCTISRQNLANGHGQWLRDAADTLSCTAFGFANVVTVMYHAVRLTQGADGAVEGGHIERPPWLGFTVHNLNAAVAWVHLFLSPHSFSPSAERLGVALALLYMLWILLCSYVNGGFPYPFLNRLPFPWGFLGTAVAAAAVFMAAFRTGRAVKRCAACGPAAAEAGGQPAKQR
uniref:Uncharacterized protein n=1 Tax=Tetraselmis sp. GSL018 TaxID=582737 RepID=A0A061QQ72_9CHLO